MKKIIAVMFIAVIAVFGLMTYAESDEHDHNNVVVEEELQEVAVPSDSEASAAAAQAAADAKSSTPDQVTTSTDPVNVTVEQTVNGVEDGQGNAVYEVQETVTYE